jgi:hypothetical protein
VSVLGGEPAGSPGALDRIAFVAQDAPLYKNLPVAALLVLDEPFSALDPVARDDFLASVTEAARDDGISVVATAGHAVRSRPVPWRNLALVALRRRQLGAAKRRRADRVQPAVRSAGAARRVRRRSAAVQGAGERDLQVRVDAGRRPHPVDARHTGGSRARGDRGDRGVHRDPLLVYTAWTSLQPDSRFWEFQLIEGGWLLALSAVFIGGTMWLVRRRGA